MKRLAKLVSRLQRRKGDATPHAAPEIPARRFRGDPPKAPRRPENIPLLVLIIGTMLLTLQQAHALDTRHAAAAVGDLITFRPGVTSRHAALPVIPAHVMTSAFVGPGRACRLNMRRITQHWGAFTVLAVRADGVMLSWAGGDTEAGGNNCAPARKLLISAHGYRLLLSSQHVDPPVMPR